MEEGRGGVKKKRRNEGRKKKVAMVIQTENLKPLREDNTLRRRGWGGGEMGKT